MDTSVIAKVIMVPLAIIGGLIGTIISIILPLAILLGVPLVIIYAIYRAVKGIMTHNAKLKSQYGDKPPDPPENRWTSGE